MNAKLTERGCRANKETCKVAIIQILEGLSPFSLTPTELDRLFYCGSCLRFTNFDDIRYRERRKVYNPDALEVEELEIECAGDVVELVREAIRRNFLRIEDMDLERGNTDTKKYRREIAKEKREEKEKVEEALSVWVREKETEDE
jgi:hypothetical protein